MTDENYLKWQYGRFEILYQQQLDGDGPSMAKQFVELIKGKYPDRLPFETCYEWCSGPGFIGFALLEANICKNLVLADINSVAVEAAKKTVEHNNLGDSVRVYHSDNLKSIPASESFDLVVSNPPNFYCLNPLHPSYAFLVNDLRPNDPEWKLHREFYKEIPQFLNPDAVLAIEEVDVFATKCFMPNPQGDQAFWGPEPYDIRARQPINDFKEMIIDNGLTFKEVVTLPEENVPVHVILSEFILDNITDDAVRIRPGIEIFEKVGAIDGDKYRVIATDEKVINGSVDLPDDQLWLLDILEILVISGDLGLSRRTLIEKSERELSEVESALNMLNRMGWIY